MAVSHRKSSSRKSHRKLSRKSHKKLSKNHKSKKSKKSKKNNRRRKHHRRHQTGGSAGCDLASIREQGLTIPAMGSVAGLTIADSRAAIFRPDCKVDNNQAMIP
jgi:hypothetical protein